MPRPNSLSNWGSHCWQRLKSENLFKIQNEVFINQKQRFYQLFSSVSNTPPLTEWRHDIHLILNDFYMAGFTRLWFELDQVFIWGLKNIYCNIYVWVILYGLT